MDTLIETLIAERGLKENTLKIYRTKLESLAKAITKKDYVNNKFLINKYDEVKQFLEQQTNSTKANYIKAILVALYPQKGIVPVSKKPSQKETAYHNFVGLLHATKVVYEETIADGGKSQKDDKNWLNWKDVLEIADQYKKLIKKEKITGKSTNLSTSQLLTLKKYVIISLYTEIPPQRTSTFIGVKYIKPAQYKKLTTEEKQNNSYLVEGGVNPYFSIGGATLKNKSDTANILPINKQLKSVLTLWKKHNPTEYLIPNNILTDEMNYKEFGKLFINVFEPYVDGKIITPSLLRKSYISSNKDYKDLEEVNTKTQDISKQMNHSISVATSVYKKK